MDTKQLKREFIQDFGDAYMRFGLQKLMGHVVGLLLWENEPVSLNYITDELQVSKGPVSQVMQRLRDNNLVQRICLPGDRKDYYQVTDDIFGVAFKSHSKLFAQNLALSLKYTDLLEQTKSEDEKGFESRIHEMTEFYSLMNRHFQAFLDEWKEVKSLKNF